MASSGSSLVNYKTGFSAYLLEFVEQHHIDIEELTNSQFSDIIWNTLEGFYSEKFSEANESKIPKRKELFNLVFQGKWPVVPFSK